MLASRLDRQRRLAQHWQSSGELPGSWRLLLHEVRARFGLDLLLAVLLRMPWVGNRLRPWFVDRTVCAFLAFDSASRDQLGCLLHPTRWQGCDVRSEAAFRLLPGVGCGSPDFVCGGCVRFAQAELPEQAALVRDFRLDSGDWFDYSTAMVALSSHPGEDV